ncbi:DNA-binding transcriptional regulator [Xanthobacter agilis]|uniref:IclR family mhp operon transcriptional activator n=1 Tax=Xanthobacter agilis TaxID=47492 RepID=A0ABU0LH45_XANAG|nr:DNA-binding transcriptional regulator [Xanthobacter agilis]MDQ0506444.1 IclR family mhp operon transcriptional activator [Xanthobacter agilis]
MEGASPYKSVRGLSRGLALLNVLNRIDGGANVARLAELTQLHRTTVHRLLETLRDEGYVRRSGSDDRYYLNLRVRELSEGFRDEQWISALASPLLGQLLKEVVWPTDLTTLDVDAMVVRETTHRFSKLSFHRSMIGRRLPLLQTASGLAYLAFCPEAERESIIDLLARRPKMEYRVARDRPALDDLLARVVQRGYGENYMAWSDEPKVAGIAVPIRGGDGLLGCLGLVYMASAMSIETAASRHLAAIRRVVGEIEAGTSRTAKPVAAPP